MNRTHRRPDNSGCHPTVDLSTGMASITENTDHPTPTPALPGRVIDLRPMFEQSARTAVAGFLAQIPQLSRMAPNAA